MVRDLKGRITSWNPTSENSYGWRKEQAVGKVSHVLLETIFPEPLDEINDKLQESGYWEGELIHKLKDGRFVRVKSTWELQPDEYNRPTVFEFNREFREFSSRLVCLSAVKNRKQGDPRTQSCSWIAAAYRKVYAVIWHNKRWWLLPALMLLVVFGLLIHLLKAPTGRLIE